MNSISQNDRTLVTDNGLPNWKEPLRDCIGQNVHAFNFHGYCLSDILKIFTEKMQNSGVKTLVKTRSTWLQSSTIQHQISLIFALYLTQYWPIQSTVTQHWTGFSFLIRLKEEIEARYMAERMKRKIHKKGPAPKLLGNERCQICGHPANGFHYNVLRNRAIIFIPPVFLSRAVWLEKTGFAC